MVIRYLSVRGRIRVLALFMRFCGFSMRFGSIFVVPGCLVGGRVLAFCLLLWVSISLAIIRGVSGPWAREKTVRQGCGGGLGVGRREHRPVVAGDLKNGQSASVFAPDRLDRREAGFAVPGVNSVSVPG